MPAYVTIVGNLGSAPEMRYTANGSAVTNFSVAVNNGEKQPDGSWTDHTDWYRASIWGKAAERAAEQLRKGNKVFIIGRLKTREYTGRDNALRTSLDVNVDQWQSLEKRERSEGGFAGPYDAETTVAPAQPVPAGNADIDDLPF
jgi:single-strand DNA-binding protein